MSTLSGAIVPEYRAAHVGGRPFYAFIFDHCALCAFFPTHKYPLTLFEPIALG
jgi:hypothetical protein